MGNLGNIMFKESIYLILLISSFLYADKKNNIILIVIVKKRGINAVQKLGIH